MAAQDRIGPDVRVVHMAELGELLAGAEDRSDPAPKPAPPAPAELQAEPAAPQPVPSAPQAVLPGTRRDQLLEVLRQHGGPLHLDVVAVALDIKRGHADEIAKQAVNAGVVQRVGNRTGKIELVEPETVESETPTVIETVPTVDPPAPVARKPRRSPNIFAYCAWYVPLSQSRVDQRGFSARLSTPCRTGRGKTLAARWNTGRKSTATKPVARSVFSLCLRSGAPSRAGWHWKCSPSRRRPEPRRALVSVRSLAIRT